jgi:ArsR family transcriptional regulator
MSKQVLSLLQTGCCSPLVEAPLTAQEAVDGAAAFKALGDPVRLRLMSVIASADGEICVCDITPQFDVSGPTVSHHLRVLREAGLIDCERRGTWVYYWPIRERLRQISTLLSVPADQLV